MGAEFEVTSLEDMCSLMCDNAIPKKKRRQHMIDAQARTNSLWSQIKRGSRTFAILSDGEPDEMRQIKSGASIQLWNKDRTKYIIKKIASVERCTINGDLAYIAWLEKGEADGIQT